MIVPTGFEFQAFRFPCGEPQVRITQVDRTPRLCWEFERADEVVEFLLICDALRRFGHPLEELVLPYVPFGRQDRVAQKGETLSLKVFADLINQCNIPRVVITDPHSDVTPALLNNVEVIHQADVFAELLASRRNFWLVAPDAGAMKKIHELAGRCPDVAGVIECTKVRDVRTGAITGVQVYAQDLEGRDAVMVDDICDGGRTFIEIARLVRTRHAGKIILCVTHGFFTKGLGVFAGLIDEVYTRKGRVL